MGTHLVTGAGAGIGEGVARALHERGESLVLLARSPQRAEEIGGAFPGARVLVADLADPGSLAPVLHDGLPEGLDSLVHAAGVVELGTVGDLPARTWQETLTVNLVAPAELTRLCLPPLRAARGHVVCVNSGAGQVAHPTWSAYAASKHGLKALADSLRGEEREHGVRVTTVYPGRTATGMQEKVHRQEGKDYDPDAWISVDSVVACVLLALDLPRDAEVTDLAVKPGPR